MATAQTVVTLSLGQILNDDASQTPATTDLNLGLSLLQNLLDQNLLDQFQLDPPSTIGLREYTYTPTAGDQTMTIGISVAVTSVTSSSTTATVTTTLPHGFAVDDYVNIAGAVQTEYNGRYQVVTVPTSTTFTYTFAGSGTSPATGTITVDPDVITDELPQRLEESSFCRLNGVDFLIGFAPSFEEYNSQPVKTNQGYPTRCFYNRNEFNQWGTLYMWPASNGAELHLWVRRVMLAGFSSMTLSTTLTLPPGLQKTLVDCLSAEMLASYSVPEPTYSQIMRKASASLRKLKRSNLQIKTLDMPIYVNGRPANTYTA